MIFKAMSHKLAHSNRAMLFLITFVAGLVIMIFGSIVKTPSSVSAQQPFAKQSIAKQPGPNQQEVNRK